MELKELKLKSVKDLKSLLAKNREILRDLRFKVSAKQLKNVKEIIKIRKIIARILFLMGQKENQTVSPVVNAQPESHLKIRGRKKLNPKTSRRVSSEVKNVKQQ